MIDRTRLSAVIAILPILLLCLATRSLGEQPEAQSPASDAAAATEKSLRRTFDEVVRPFLRSYCLDCHSGEEPEAKLDLSVFSSLQSVSENHPTWAIVLERLEAGEMPPSDAEQQPSASENKSVVAWLKALRQFDGSRTAGDPGPVLARRLSNAEYDYTIRDLTHVDIRPTHTFPVDPANEAGFDNSGESLTMSPALLNKYLEAARHVADHLVFTPTDLSFAPHPVVTDTDRDKFCVKRIVEFYERQPTDLADYFLVCWQYRRSQTRPVESSPAAAGDELARLAAAAGVSPRYAGLVWDVLHQPDAFGPLARLQQLFRQLPKADDVSQVVASCEQMRDYVFNIRARLSPSFEDLMVPGSHKGSQPFVLWKNRQYAAHRRDFDRSELVVEGDDFPEDTPAELVLPRDEESRAAYLASLKRFCSVFPDAFYISERGRDYLGVPREKQEKGRLLSAGFHSMMGYFRDDGPLCELILTASQRDTLDRLWRELDYITSAPTRQYSGFLWFERTDSRYMRDPEFDFARAEDKSAASEAMIKKLVEVYLDKARRNGGGDVAIDAIETFFHNINTQIRRVEKLRVQSEPLHVRLLVQLAARAWRRPLSSAESQRIRDFYRQLREQDRLEHEEAMRDSLVAILMSPHFLYRTDLVSVGDGVRPLNSFEVASRLSYFLWSTMPDDPLLELIESPDDPLQDAEVVAAQARRMLQDVRVRGLATEFAANWLDIRRFDEHNSVDRNHFPQFTDSLRQAMFEEPIRFFMDLVQNDRPVQNLLEADYTFANGVLAEHYGFPEIKADKQRWVKVVDAGAHGRGGLLPMAVFLTKNSPGLRTSPVKRGYWVVRRLLGERIPPPPPDVPELPADERQLGDLSLRETLARHRNHQSCAVCHDRFDGIGVAFEGFGPIGQRRKHDLGGRPVETEADFPGGSQGLGLNGVQRYLREHRQEEFIDNLCRKLLSYALGRTLMLSDEPLVETMKANLRDDEYRFSSMIESIVTSRQFLTKRGRVQLVQQEGKEE